MEDSLNTTFAIKTLEAADLSDYVINCMPGVFFLQTEEGKYLRWNKNLETVSGYITEEVKDINALSFFHGPELARVVEQIKLAFEKGSASIEATIVTKSGEKKPYYFVACGVIYNGQRCIIGCGVDITEKIAAEEVLQKSKAELNTIFDNTDTSYIVLNTEFKVLTINPIGTINSKLFFADGISVGEDLISKVPEGRKQTTLNYFNRALAGETVEYDLDVNAYDIGDNCFSIRIVPIKSDDGKIYGICYSALDITARKLAEREIINSGLKYQSLFQQASDAIMITDFEGNFIDVNEGMCKMLGYSKEELLGMNINNLIEAEQLKNSPIQFGLLAQGQHITNYRKMLHKNGSIVEVEANVKKFGEGMVMAIARNITQIREVQKQVEISEATFRGAFEFSANGMAIVGLKGEWLKVNKELCTMLGYAPDEFVKLTFQDITHPDDLAADLENLQRLNAGLIDTYRSEKRYIHKNGLVVWISLNVAMIKDGNAQPLYFITQVENITGKRNAERQIKESEKKYRTLIEQASDAITLFDLTGKFTEVNEQACALFGYTKEEMLQLNIADMMPPEHLQHLPIGWNDLLAGKNVFNERTIIKKDGTIAYIEVNSKLFSGDKVLGIVRDVTEKKLIERELVNAEVKFRSLVEKSQVGVYIIQHSKFAYVNPSFTQIFGYTTAELVNNIHFENVILPEDRTFAWEKTPKRADGENASTHYEIRGIKKDRTGIRLEVYGSRTMYNGEAAVIGTLIDITERKAAEQALVESEAYLHSLFDTTDNSYILVDKSLHVLTYNQRAENFIKNELGHSTNVGDYFPNYFNPDRITQLHKIWESVLQGNAINYEISYPQPNGTTNWYFARKFPIRNAANEVLGLMLALSDISERKKEEQEKERTRYLLNERVKELTTLYRTGQIIQTGGHTESVLQSIANILPEGWQYPEVAGACITLDNTAYQTPNYTTGVHTQSAGFQLSNGTTGVIEVVYLEEKPEVHEGPFAAEERNLIDMVAEMLRTYLDRQRDERQREKITADLVQRNKDLEQFAYIISHNLRAPVANIIGFSSILNEEGQSPEETKMLTAELANSVAKLDDVIRDLNHILQAKREVSEMKEPVSFSKILHNVEVSIKNMIAKENVLIKSDFTAAPEMQTLKSYVHSIFYNLITNSIKYRRPDVSPVIAIQSRKENGKIMLVFTDNGMGIDMDKKGEQVFGLYKRFHPQAAEGKGVGLFMTKTQVETIGGKINITSRVNEGTEFVIELPE